MFAKSFSRRGSPPPDGCPSMQKICARYENVNTVSFYNGSRQLTAQVDPAGLRTSYSYDGAGNQKTVTDSNGRVTTTLYDAANHPTSAQAPATRPARRSLNLAWCPFSMRSSSSALILSCAWSIKPGLRPSG